jgi:hypothetical protein
MYRKILDKALPIWSQYCRVVTLSGQKYDLVVVDGHDRGVDLLDDTRRENSREGINHLKKGAIALSSLKA